MQSVIEKTKFATVDDVSGALDQTIESFGQGEIDRRTASALGASHFYPPSSGDIAFAAASFIEQVSARYQPSEIEKAVDTATQKVMNLGELHRRREEFHGKSVLQAFYSEHVHRTGLPKVVFSFETARHARRRRAVVAFFDNFFAKLEEAGNPKILVSKQAGEGH